MKEPQKKPRRLRAVVEVGYTVKGKRKDVAPGGDCSDCPNGDWLLAKGYAVEGPPLDADGGGELWHTAP